MQKKESLFFTCYYNHDLAFDCFGGEVVEHGRDFDEAREEAARLRSLQVDASNLKLVSIDQLAVEPLRPIKPKKALILALGLVLGGMLGLFIALIRNMVRRKPDMLDLDAGEVAKGTHSP